MKRLVALVLTGLMVFGFFGCNQPQQQETPSFMVGFGKVDITPTQPIHMMSYTDPANHISQGALSKLYAMSIVLRDAAGTTMVMAYADMGTISNTMLNEVRPLIQERLGIEEKYITLSSPHNHNGPAYNYSAPYDMEWKTIFNEGIVESVEMAIADLAPATIQIGRTETENLTFVRRYLMSCGCYNGDNFSCSHKNNKPVEYESEADEQVQMVRFVRDGKKDVLVVNWQSHAAKHGHTDMLSADYVGALRDKVEQDLDVHCMYFQGAAGNLNPTSRFEGACPTGAQGFERAVLHGNAVAKYVIDACNTDGVFHSIKSGNIHVDRDYFVTLGLGAEANVITAGDLSFVTLPAEFFCSLGQDIKQGTPYEMTVLMGYTCGSDGAYLPDKEGFDHGGYEADKSGFRYGDGERFVEFFLEKLNNMHRSENP